MLSHFDCHARNWAHALAHKNRWSEAQMDVIYIAIMNFIDQAVDTKKVEVKEQKEWDEIEHGFRQAIQDEAIKRGVWDGAN